jgi:nanoRNase/pAp phosphatase (c-di-AMP/oligoRNAs hydrolase)
MTATLTPEQIAEFERRAAAGEKPEMPWTYSGGTSTTNPIREHLIDLPGVIVQRHHEFWRLYNICPPTFECLFPSATATKLAAEYLLKEASRPLWQRELLDLESAQQLLVENEAGAELMNADKAEMRAEIDRLKAWVAELLTKCEAIDCRWYNMHKLQVESLKTLENRLAEKELECQSLYTFRADYKKRMEVAEKRVAELEKAVKAEQTPEEAEAGKAPEQPTILHHPV